MCYHSNHPDLHVLRQSLHLLISEILLKTRNGSPEWLNVYGSTRTLRSGLQAGEAQETFSHPPSSTFYTAFTEHKQRGKIVFNRRDLGIPQEKGDRLERIIHTTSKNRPAINRNLGVATACGRPIHAGCYTCPFLSHYYTRLLK